MLDRRVLTTTCLARKDLAGYKRERSPASKVY
jgi:hypothetical protein